MDITANNSQESRHRTLYISHTEPTLTGEYTCKVSTLASDDQVSKSMLVFGKFVSMYGFQVCRIMLMVYRHGLQY